MLTRKECFDLLEKHKTPQNVKNHCIKVSEVAVRLAEALNRKGFQLDVAAIERAALLHDIARVHPRHAQMGSEILKSQGEHVLENIIRQHMELDPQNIHTISEVTLVYLADKVVKEDEIVTVEERYSYAEEKFSENPIVLKNVLQSKHSAIAIRGLVEEAIGVKIGSLIS